MRARLHRTTSRRWLAGAATASAALAGVGLASPAALADPEAAPQECPAAYPVAELVSGAPRYRVSYRGGEHVTDDPTALLHELTAAALARGERLEDLSVTRPSLEDVYLELTE